MTTSLKIRSVCFGKTEVYCGYCGGLVTARGAKAFCSPACYHEKRRSQPVEQRFWSKVDRSSVDGCWLWLGSCFTVGYGQFTRRSEDGTSQHIGAHVMAWELTHGPVPDGLEIMHSCDVRRCVRPDHLSVGTHAENVQDAARKGRLHVSRPNRQKLTADQIQEIRSLVTSGEKRFRVAMRFGISKTQVTLIMQGKRRQYDAPLVPALEQVS